MSTLTPTLKLLKVETEAATLLQNGEAHAPWLPTSAFLDPASGALEQALAQVLPKVPELDERTRVSFFLSGYLWYILYPVICVYLKDQRALRLAPEHIYLKAATDNSPYEVGFARPHYVTLAPVSPDPCCDFTVADAPTLLLVLRDEIVFHVSALLASLKPYSRFSTGALWKLVSDRLAVVFLYAGRALNCQPQALSDALTLMHQEGSPLFSPRVNFQTVAVAGVQDTFLQRGTCCRNDRVPGGKKCDNCVHYSQDERRKRLAASLLARKEQAS